MKKSLGIALGFRLPAFLRLLVLLLYALISSQASSQTSSQASLSSQAAPPLLERRNLRTRSKDSISPLGLGLEDKAISPESSSSSSSSLKSSQRQHQEHQRSLFELSQFWVNPIHKNINTDDIFSQDADADDDFGLIAPEEDTILPVSLAEAANTDANTNTNTNSTLQHYLDLLPKTNCTWYTLSHYIPPDTILYDSIEGVLIALLFCLVMATFYNMCYYCCFVRCGCCPDDRIYLSKLHKQGRKGNRLARPNRRRISRGRGTGWCCGYSCCSCFCCCCCWKKDKDGKDGKGAFMLISNETDSVSEFSFNNSMDDDHSSLSLDSALSLEYGDDHLHNEYGEVTSRWDDAKIEEAAKAYFEVEEKMSEEFQAVAAGRMKRGGGRGSSSIKSKTGSRKKGDRSVRSKKSNRSRKSGRSGKSRSGRSRRSERSKRSSHNIEDGSTVYSQSSSILTSDSENSYSSRSSSDDEIEMEDAMMDLDVEHRRVRLQALQMLQRADNQRTDRLA